MSRIRVALGLAVVGIAGYMSRNPATPLADVFSVSWPYLLMIFAAVTALVILIDIRRLSGPLILAAVGGLGLGIKSGWPILDYAPILATAGGAWLALSGVRASRPNRLVSVAWPGRRVLRDRLPDRIDITCLLTSVSVDLRDTTLSNDTVIAVSTIAGHVSLHVPASWPVVLDDMISALVAVDERGRRDSVDTAAPGLRLRAGGAFGWVSLERH